ncbi:OmpH family outer membrane protein [Halioxenophilus sp. WMMB6]|uniref:OmpH family outer membrane protein n=1 Tax=Halioxenophilus sp. WMMB6 TaxID=3073815 RepID=UPI00295E8014|nr:OmpH family outer membrane protein [Halioxenophilus sp. WMMB6]
MINLKTIFALALLSLGSVPAFAAGKVVIFNFEKAILSTEAAKKVSADLQANAEFAAMQAKYEGIVADLEKLRDEQMSKGMTWNADQQAEHRKKVEYLRADLELAQKKIQAEQNAAVRSLLGEFEGKTKQVLNEVIQAEGIAIVLNAQSVYYAEPSADITAMVTEKLNKMK